MSFKDLDDFFKIKPIRLPIRGKKYAFPGSVSGRTGLLLHRMTEMAEAVKHAQETGEAPDLDAAALDDAGEINLRREVLGDTEQLLLDDDIPAVYIDHVFKTLIVWHQFGEEVAQQVWEDVPGAPKAPTDRKPPKGTSASATGTRKQASTRSTSGSTGKRSGGTASSSTGT